MEKAGNTLTNGQSEEEYGDGPLSRFEKLTGITVWTNRLDRRLYSRLDSLKRWLAEMSARLARLEQQALGQTEKRGDVAGSSFFTTELTELRQESERWYRERYPELVELCLVASDHVYMLDSAAVDMSRRLDLARQQGEKLLGLIAQLETSPSYRLGRLALRPLRAFRSLLQDNQQMLFRQTAEQVLAGDGPTDNAAARPEQPAEERKLCFDFGFGVRERPHAAIDNTGTGLAIFDDWVSVYHYNGRYYGSRNPCIDDHMPHLLGVHERIRLNGKRILEIGPFEGAHTKQLHDLNAASITAIESNSKAYLKCLTIKSEFALANAEFVYGDCNEILRRAEYRSRSFDFCLASGVLYHMEDPLGTIDLLLSFAPVIYVWTQVASERSPAGEWTVIKDSEGRSYRGRRNIYQTEQHWGGVGPGAFWLDKEDLLRAFEERGMVLEQLQESENAAGAVVSFLAGTAC
jgi:hypothetical protein